MDARTIAELLSPAMFPGPYRREADVYPDLKVALQTAAGNGATVFVEQQDHGVLPPTLAFGRNWRPDGLIEVDGVRIVVEAKLLTPGGDRGCIGSAIAQAAILTLDFDQGLKVVVDADKPRQLAPRERELLDALWETHRVAWCIVTAHTRLEALLGKDG